MHKYTLKISEKAIVSKLKSFGRKIARISHFPQLAHNQWQMLLRRSKQGKKSCKRAPFALQKGSFGSTKGFV